MNWVRNTYPSFGNEREVENIKKQYGKSPIAWFDELGLFDTDAWLPIASGLTMMIWISWPENMYAWLIIREAI